VLAPAGAADRPAGNRLDAVIERYWDDQLRTHPGEATIFVGDQHQAGQLDDPSLETFQDLLVAQLGEFQPTATIGDLKLFLNRL
jgi:hypothetical protein